MDQHQFGDAALRATVAARGAEPCSLHATGRGELLWDAGAPWKRHAPVLFPIVGRLNGDMLRVGDARYRLPQHGFARDQTFRLIETDHRSCRLELADDDSTRAVYPFPFRLAVEYEIEAGRFTATWRVTNTGDAALPASLGVHPAFRWPLAPGVPREAHALRFERFESGPVRQLVGGLLAPAPAANPVRGDLLPLRDALFDDDALILQQPASRSVRLEAEGLPWAVEISWDGFTTLGLWARRADFLCIEPWSGYADPVGFDGWFTDKPGLLHLAPGETIVRRYAIRVV